MSKISSSLSGSLQLEPDIKMARYIADFGGTFLILMKQKMIGDGDVYLDYMQMQT